MISGILGNENFDPTHGGWQGVRAARRFFYSNGRILDNKAISMTTDKKRASLLVRCRSDEAEEMRKAAKHEHRTLSGYILHAVLGRIAHQKQVEEEWRKRVRPGGVSEA